MVEGAIVEVAVIYVFCGEFLLEGELVLENSVSGVEELLEGEAVFELVLEVVIGDEEGGVEIWEEGGGVDGVIVFGVLMWCVFEVVGEWVDL